MLTVVGCLESAAESMLEGDMLRVGRAKVGDAGREAGERGADHGIALAILPVSISENSRSVICVSVQLVGM